VKYFTYELIAAAGAWRNETIAEQQAASRKLDRATFAYCRHLDKTRPKVPPAAWRFFRHGNPENTLHDSRLMNMSIGDIPVRGLGWTSSGRTKFASVVRLEFLTYEEDRLYIMECRGLHRIESIITIPHSDEFSDRNQIGDLYTYELRSGPKGRLQLGFLFVSGATIELEFESLRFRIQPMTKSKKRK
jgi:hypothetical protein